MRNNIIVYPLAFALIFVGASVVFTNILAQRLALQERSRVEIWAQATRQIAVADDRTDISFYSDIIERNTTIPVYMTDEQGNVLLTRNVKTPKKNVDEFYRRKISELSRSQEPIEVVISPDISQYIYYDESNLLTALRYFPYIQFAVLLVFLLIAAALIYTSYNAEQNRVWVGLTKETAHQLGTPLSSLNGWSALLKQRYPDDELLPEMDADIARLQTIAERFGKVGSEPQLVKLPLDDLLADTVAYMRTRVSNKVHMQVIANDAPYMAAIDAPLMSWVIENLIKNAVDAMEGQGSITLTLTHQSGHRVALDVTDTGKGIERRRFNTIFRPGYTTKKRGWGLGLSLAKRIVEEYHHGKIFVLSSSLTPSASGTTFRILLP